MDFSTSLKSKIEIAKNNLPKCKLGALTFRSPLMMAPLASITDLPFRRLMSKLGAGGVTSELISCHGINYMGEKTLRMLEIHEEEEMTGLQLFGEDAESISKAAQVAMKFKPQFIDLNMGCPVRKVVKKGAGSGLLREIHALPEFFKIIKASIPMPFTIKIRIGWDHDNLVAHDVVQMAHDAGIEYVAIHGRTQTQAYTGHANWDYIEEVARAAKLPIVGNGDLIEKNQIKERLATTACSALMIGRGALKNPFLFLEAFNQELIFTGEDYLEVLQLYHHYLCDYKQREAVQLMQLKKQVVWWSSGFRHASSFRKVIFPSKTIAEVLQHSEAYFSNIKDPKITEHDESFLTGGHG